MAYEVIKTISGREYRYRVESVRDPKTGKRRNRWTYMGRVKGTKTTPPAKRRDGNTRKRLLDALEGLLAKHDFTNITAGAIASEAALAHGTFYRHFRDKGEALLAAFDRVREWRAPLNALPEQLASVDEARKAIRTFVDVTLHWPPVHVSLLRTYLMLAMQDPKFARERRARRKAIVRQLAEGFAELRSRGYTALRDPEATAAALCAMLDGIFREAMIDGEPLDEAWIAAAARVFERAVFDESGRQRDTRAKIR